MKPHLHPLLRCQPKSFYSQPLAQDGQKAFPLNIHTHRVRCLKTICGVIGMTFPSHGDWPLAPMLLDSQRRCFILLCWSQELILLLHKPHSFGCVCFVVIFAAYFEAFITLGRCTLNIHVSKILTYFLGLSMMFTGIINDVYRSRRRVPELRKCCRSFPASRTSPFLGLGALLQ